jgi:hypothetical protein
MNVKLYRVRPQYVHILSVALVVALSVGARAQQYLTWTCQHGHVYTVTLADVSQSVGAVTSFETGDGHAFADPSPAFSVAGAVARVDLGSVSIVQGFSGHAWCVATATLRPHWTVSVSPALSGSVSLVAQDRSSSSIETSVMSEGGWAYAQAHPPTAALGLTHYCDGGRPYSAQLTGYGPLSYQEVVLTNGYGDTVVPFLNSTSTQCYHGEGFGDDYAESHVSTGVRVVGISTPCGGHTWVTPGSWTW